MIRVSNHLRTELNVMTIDRPIPMVRTQYSMQSQMPLPRDTVQTPFIQQMNETKMISIKSILAIPIRWPHQQHPVMLDRKMEHLIWTMIADNFNTTTTTLIPLELINFLLLTISTAIYCGLEHLWLPGTITYLPTFWTSNKTKNLYLPIALSYLYAALRALYFCCFFPLQISL